MRSDVPLIGVDSVDPSILPDLIGVFRAAQKEGPLSYTRQAYFNSWILTGIFHNNDSNTQLTLRKRPSITQIAYNIMQYAIDPDYMGDIDTMDIRTLRTLTDRQANLIGFFHRRLQGAEIDINPLTLSLAHAGKRFNEYVADERERFIAHKQADKDKKPTAANFMFVKDPFVPAHFATHMMYILGLRLNLRDADRERRLSSVFASYVQQYDRSLPYEMPAHRVNDAATHHAIDILRAINLRLEGMLRAASGRRVLSEGTVCERRLVEELFMYTKPFREPQPESAPAVRRENIVLFSDLQKQRADRNALKPH